MPHNKPSPLLELTGLHFRYPRVIRHDSYADERWLIRDVNLAVYPGDRVGIIGDNGSGKSTLFNLVLGLRTPTQGKVRIFGEMVGWRRSYPRLGYVGDPSHSGEELGLPMDLTVGELIHAYRALFVTSRVPIRTRRLASRLGLYKLHTREVATLSTGERKRLMTFLALAKEPQLLLMDEPLDGIDGEMREQVEELLVDYVARSGCAIVYISHNLAELATVTTHLYQLTDGVIRRVVPIEFSVVYQENGGESRHRHNPGQVESKVVKAVHRAASTGEEFSMRLWRESEEMDG